MIDLSYRLDRTVTIQAQPETVFRFFTDSARWASWWGAGSAIEARPGGAVKIRYPGGVEVSGEVVELRSPEHIVFTYGYVSGKPIPPGSSRVTIRLEPAADGTRLHLRHEFADAAVRDEHVQGWRFQLSLFGNAVANEVHAGAASVVDAWFGLWSVADEKARAAAVAKLASPCVRFHDQYSLLEGQDDLTAHIGASQRFMPGMRLERKGDVRHCQGTVLVDWVALANDGQQRGTGTNVFLLGAEGRIDSVTGFWNR
jgi:uncharacterized protein YndB with AHSA1/START domain